MTPAQLLLGSTIARRRSPCLAAAGGGRALDARICRPRVWLCLPLWRPGRHAAETEPGRGLRAWQLGPFHRRSRDAQGAVAAALAQQARDRLHHRTAGDRARPGCRPMSASMSGAAPFPIGAGARASRPTSILSRRHDPGQPQVVSRIADGFNLDGKARDRRFRQPGWRARHRQCALPRLGLRCALPQSRQRHPGPARKRPRCRKAFIPW